MVLANQTNYWMRIGPRPNVDGIFALWYRIGRRSEDHGEIWTRRTNEFKDGQPAAVTAGVAVIREASQHLRPLLGSSLPAPPLQDVAPELTLFIPALGHEETASQPQNKLSRFAAAAAAGYGANMSWQLLSKNPHDSLSRTGANAARRVEILTEANYQATKVDARYLVVVDDVSTTGQTLSTIAAAVKTSNPTVRVFAIVLAKQESLEYLSSATAEEANARVPLSLDQIWRQHAP